MHDPTKMNKIPSIIPEFCFDLISRIPVGGLSLIVIFYELGWFSKGQLFSPSYLFGLSPGVLTIIFTVFLGASYTIGIIIQTLGDIFLYIYQKNIWEQHNDYLEQLITQLEYRMPITVLKNDYKAINALITDYLRNYNPHSGLVAIKLSAENSLCNNLTATLTIYFLYTTYSLIAGNANINKLYFLAIGIAVSFLIARDRYKQQVLRRITMVFALGTIGDKISPSI